MITKNDCSVVLSQSLPSYSFCAIVTFHPSFFCFFVFFGLRRALIPFQIAHLSMRNFFFNFISNFWKIRNATHRFYYTNFSTASSIHMLPLGYWILNFLFNWFRTPIIHIHTMVCLFVCLLFLRIAGQLFLPKWKEIKRNILRLYHSFHLLVPRLYISFDEEQFWVQSVRIRSRRHKTSIRPTILIYLVAAKP